MRAIAAQDEQPCPIKEALDILGDAWSMLILRDAGAGISRFDHFRKNLLIAPNILTHRLAALTGAGMLERRKYSDRPPRFEYTLTPAGEDFLPVLFAIGSWRNRHAGEMSQKSLVHAETGVPVELIVVDENSGTRINGRNVRISGTREDR
jgi:DNA-binding HxlR family transcriptional regulator